MKQKGLQRSLEQMKTMNILVKTFAAFSIASCSITALACSPNSFDGTFSLNGKTITIQEKPRCSAQFVYQEWKPSQRPYKGKPLLRLKGTSYYYAGNRQEVHFKKGSAEYILSVPDDAKTVEGQYEDVKDKLTLSILMKGRQEHFYTLRRTGY